MLAGHLAFGLALKARYRATPLLVILFSVLLLDWLWLVLVWQGVEAFQVVETASEMWQRDLHGACYSHGLFWAFFYALCVFLVFVRAEGQRHWAVPLSLGVFSHWLLDSLGFANLPFANFGPALNLGFGLSAVSPILSLLVEGMIVLLGWGIYYRSQRGTASARWLLRASLVALVVLLLAQPVWWSWIK